MNAIFAISNQTKYPARALRRSIGETEHFTIDAPDPILGARCLLRLYVSPLWNPVPPAPARPVTQAALQTARDQFSADMAKLLATGFEAVSTNRASQPLPKPDIRDLLHSNTGQVIMRVTPIANARNYEPQCALIGPGGTPGPWVSAGLFSNSRSMPVHALTPGSEYLFRVRALGGSTDSSDWSDTRSHRSLLRQPHRLPNLTA